jgi:hypothetical protein
MIQISKKFLRKTVLVKWLDASGDSHWRDAADAEAHTLSSIEEVGFLWSIRKDSILIVSAISDKGNVNGVGAIPIVNIQSIKQLK